MLRFKERQSLTILILSTRLHGTRSGSYRYPASTIRQTLLWDDLLSLRSRRDIVARCLLILSTGQLRELKSRHYLAIVVDSLFYLVVMSCSKTCTRSQESCSTGLTLAKYASICIARFIPKASNALRHGSNSFTCKLHHACLYSPAAEHHRPLAGTHFTIPRRVKGWVDLGGWLHTKIKCRPGVEPGRSTIPVLTGLSVG